MKDCAHQNFAAQVDVNRLEDVGRFVADVRIRCADCGADFVFACKTIGLHWDRPSVDVRGVELRVAIHPEGEPPTGDDPPGFEVRAR